MNRPVIAALSTAPGVGAVAIIRISGRGCLDIVKPYLDCKVDHLKARQAYYCHYVVDGQFLDDVIALYFQGPSSFTGEDVVEIYCHGGTYVVQSILNHLLSLEIQPAAPGEFSRRAFLNGKMDLIKAEGLAALIEAQSKDQWQAAQSLKQGRLSASILALRDRLIEAMAFLEARIDFPDEGDTASVSLEMTTTKVREVLTEVQSLVGSYQSGKVATYGLRVVFLGPPNAGKSTLLNTLLGEERAIVTNVPGTTRDFIEERCLINGKMVSIVDTAGLRDTKDAIEAVGVESAQKLAHEADLVVCLVGADQSQETLDEVAQWSKDSGFRQSIKVLSKADIEHGFSLSEDWVPVSCVSPGGVDLLKQSIEDVFDSFVGSTKNAVFITSSRHLELLKNVEQALLQYIEKAQFEYDECLAFELQSAARCLQEVVGDIHSEDILERIFSRFCVGK